MVKPVEAVVIVGGGTAGWLTAGTSAARLQARMKAGGFSVTLVESPNEPTIGVGEGTWPTLRETLQRIGVSETALFRECDAAFKQGGQFVGWTTGAASDSYYHPLMIPQGFARVNLLPRWLADERAETVPEAQRLVQETARMSGELCARLPKNRELLQKIYQYGLQPV